MLSQNISSAPIRLLSKLTFPTTLVWEATQGWVWDVVWAKATVEVWGEERACKLVEANSQKSPIWRYKMPRGDRTGPLGGGGAGGGRGIGRGYNLSCPKCGTKMVRG